MKFIYIILITLGVGYYVSHAETMTVIDYMIMFAVASFVGKLLKEYEKTSKNINDLKKYRTIDKVIKKYGVPDNIEQFAEYKKYTFKKSTNGWGHNKYKVDIFTLQNDQLVKHERFYE